MFCSCALLGGSEAAASTASSSGPFGNLPLPSVQESKDLKDPPELSLEAGTMNDQGHAMYGT